MNTNIRGLPAEQLLPSELLPILDSLKNLTGSGNKIEEEISAARFRKIATFAISVMAAVVFQFLLANTHLPPLLGATVGFLFTLLVARTVTEVSFCDTIRFAGNVRKLDQLLKKNGLREGVAESSLKGSWALREVSKDLILGRILEVTRSEDVIASGTLVGNEEATMARLDQLRRDYRALAELLRQEFETDVGPFGPMFKVASETLAKEKKLVAAVRGVNS